MDKNTTFPVTFQWTKTALFHSHCDGPKKEHIYWFQNVRHSVYRVYTLKYIAISTWKLANDLKRVTLIASVGHHIAKRRRRLYATEWHLKVHPRGIVSQIIIFLTPTIPLIVLWEYHCISQITAAIVHRAEAASIWVVIPTTIFHRFVLRQTPKQSACVPSETPSKRDH